MALCCTSVNQTHRHMTKQRQWVRAQTAAPPRSGVWGREGGRSSFWKRYRDCWRLDRAEAPSGCSKLQTGHALIQLVEQDNWGLLVFLWISNRQTEINPGHWKCWINSFEQHTSRAGTNQIIFFRCQLIVWSLKCTKTLEKEANCTLWAQADVFKVLVLSKKIAPNQKIFNIRDTKLTILVTQL